MTKLQILYVKLNAAWDSLPSWVKPIVYGLISVLLTRLTDDIINGVAISPQTYYAIAMTYGYNALLKILKDLQSGKPLEELQSKYNKEMLGR